MTSCIMMEIHGYVGTEIHQYMYVDIVIAYGKSWGCVDVVIGYGKTMYKAQEVFPHTMREQ